MAQKVNNGEAMKKILFTKMQFSRWINFFLCAAWMKWKTGEKQILVVIAASIRFIHPKNLVKEASKRTEDWGDGGKEIMFENATNFCCEAWLHMWMSRRVDFFFAFFPIPNEVPHQLTHSQLFYFRLMSFDARLMMSSLSRIASTSSSSSFLTWNSCIDDVAFRNDFLRKLQRPSQSPSRKETDATEQANGSGALIALAATTICTFIFCLSHSLTHSSMHPEVVRLLVLFFLLQLLLHHQLANYP